MTLYQFLCANCGWKKITESTEIGLAEVKSSPIPRGIPHMDPVTGDMITPKFLKPKKKYKCPNCGQVISPKTIENPQEVVEQKMNMEKRIQKRLENDEKERQKQLERELKKQQYWADGSQRSPP